MSDERRQEQDDIEELLDLLDKQERGEEIDEERFYELDLLDRARRGEELTEQELEDYEFLLKVREQDKRDLEEYLALLERKENGEAVDEAKLFYLELLDQRRNGEELAQEELDFIRDFEDAILAPAGAAEQALPEGERLDVHEEESLYEQANPVVDGEDLRQPDLDSNVSPVEDPPIPWGLQIPSENDENEQLKREEQEILEQEAKLKEQIKAAEEASKSKAGEPWGLRMFSFGGSEDEQERKKREEKEKQEREEKLKQEAEAAAAKKKEEEEAKRKAEEAAKSKQGEPWGLRMFGFGGSEDEQERKKREEAEKQEREAKQKQEEEDAAKKKEQEEAKRKEEEEKRKAEEAAREEEKRKAEEAKRKAEEAKRKEAAESKPGELWGLRMFSFAGSEDEQERKKREEKETLEREEKEKLELEAKQKKAADEAKRKAEEAKSKPGEPWGLQIFGIGVSEDEQERKKREEAEKQERKAKLKQEAEAAAAKKQEEDEAKQKAEEATKAEEAEWKAEEEKRKAEEAAKSKPGEPWGLRMFSFAGSEDEQERKKQEEKEKKDREEKEKLEHEVRLKQEAEAKKEEEAKRKAEEASKPKSGDTWGLQIFGIGNSEDEQERKKREEKQNREREEKEKLDRESKQEAEATETKKEGEKEVNWKAGETSKPEAGEPGVLQILGIGGYEDEQERKKREEKEKHVRESKQKQKAEATEAKDQEEEEAKRKAAEAAKSKEGEPWGLRMFSFAGSEDEQERKKREEEEKQKCKEMLKEKEKNTQAIEEDDIIPGKETSGFELLSHDRDSVAERKGLEGACDEERELEANREGSLFVNAEHAIEATASEAVPISKHAEQGPTLKEEELGTSPEVKQCANQISPSLWKGGISGDEIRQAEEVATEVMRIIEEETSPDKYEATQMLPQEKPKSDAVSADSSSYAEESLLTLLERRSRWGQGSKESASPETVANPKEYFQTEEVPTKEMRRKAEESIRMANEDARLMEDEVEEFKAAKAVSFEQEARLKAEEEKLRIDGETSQFWGRKFSETLGHQVIEEKKLQTEEAVAEAMQQLVKESSWRKAEVEARMQEDEHNRSRLNADAMSDMTPERRLEPKTMITSETGETVWQRINDESRQDALAENTDIEKYRYDTIGNSAPGDAQSPYRKDIVEELETAASLDREYDLDEVSIDVDESFENELFERKHRNGFLDDDELYALELFDRRRNGEQLYEEELEDLEHINRKRRELKADLVELRERKKSGEKVDEDLLYELELFERLQKGNNLDKDELYEVKQFKRLRRGEDIGDTDLDELDFLRQCRLENEREDQRIIQLLNLQKRGENIDEDELYELQLFKRKRSGEKLDDDELFELEVYTRARAGEKLHPDELDELDLIKQKRYEDEREIQLVATLREKKSKGERVDEVLLYELLLRERKRDVDDLNDDEEYMLELFERKRMGEDLKDYEIDDLGRLIDSRLETAMTDSSRVDEQVDYERKLLERQSKGKALDDNEYLFLRLLRQRRDDEKLRDDEIAKLNELTECFNKRSKLENALMQQLHDLRQLKTSGSSVDENRLYQLELFRRKINMEDLDDNEMRELELIERLHRGESLSKPERDELDHFRLVRDQLARDLEHLAILRDRKRRGEDIDEEKLYELELFERKRMGVKLDGDELCELKLLERVRREEMLQKDEVLALQSFRQKRRSLYQGIGGKSESMGSDASLKKKKRKVKKKKMRKKKKNAESTKVALAVETKQTTSLTAKSQEASSKESTPTKPSSTAPSSSVQGAPKAGMFRGLFGGKSKKEIELEKERQRQEELIKEQLKALELENELEVLEQEKEMQELLVRETIERKRLEGIPSQDDDSSSWETDSDWDDEGSEWETDSDEGSDSNVPARTTTVDAPRSNLDVGQRVVRSEAGFSQAQEVVPADSRSTSATPKHRLSTVVWSEEVETHAETVLARKKQDDKEDDSVSTASSGESSLLSGTTLQTAKSEKPMDVAEVLAAARDGKLKPRKSKATHLSKYLEAEKGKRQRKNKHGDEISLGTLDMKKKKSKRDDVGQNIGKEKKKKQQRPWGESKVRPRRSARGGADSEKNDFFESNQHVFERSVFNFDTSFNDDDSETRSKVSQADTALSDVKGNGLLESMHFNGNDYEAIESKLAERIKENDIDFNEVWEKTEMDKNVAAHIIQKREQRKREKSKGKAKGKNGDGDFPRLLLFEGEKQKKKRKKSKNRKKRKKLDYTLSKEFRKAMNDVFEEDEEEAYDKTFGEVIKDFPKDMKAKESTFSIGDDSIGQGSQSGGESEPSDPFEDDNLKRLRARSLQHEVKQVLREPRDQQNASSDRSQGSRSRTFGRKHKQAARRDSDSVSRASGGSQRHRTRSHGSSRSRQRDGRNSGSDARSRGSRSSRQREGAGIGRMATRHLDATEVYARALEHQKQRKVFSISELRQEMEDLKQDLLGVPEDVSLGEHEQPQNYVDPDTLAALYRQGYMEPLPVAPEMQEEEKKGTAAAKRFALKLFTKVKSASDREGDGASVLGKGTAGYGGSTMSGFESRMDASVMSDKNPDKSNNVAAKSFAMKLFSKAKSNDETDEHSVADSHIPQTVPENNPLANRFAKKMLAAKIGRTADDTDGNSVATRERPKLPPKGLNALVGNITSPDSEGNLLPVPELDPVASGFAAKIFAKHKTGDDDGNSVATKERPLLGTGKLSTSSEVGNTASFQEPLKTTDRKALTDRFAAKLLSKTRGAADDDDINSLAPNERTSKSVIGERRGSGVSEGGKSTLADRFASKLLAKTKGASEDDGNSVATRERPSLAAIIENRRSGGFQTEDNNSVGSRFKKRFAKSKAGAEDDGNSVATRERPPLSVIGETRASATVPQQEQNPHGNRLATHLMMKPKAISEFDANSVASRDKAFLPSGLHDGMPSQHNPLGNRIAAKLLGKTRTSSKRTDMATTVSSIDDEPWTRLGGLAI